MFKGKRSGGRYTFASILIVLVVLYGFKFTLSQKHVEYPDRIHYNGASYQYEETVRKSPTGFVRKKGVCDEGFI
ncbi:MAG: hypothetical protein ACM3TR_01725, partial [Caulobacteraceae bacterium]